MKEVLCLLQGPSPSNPQQKQQRPACPTGLLVGTGVEQDGHP